MRNILVIANPKSGSHQGLSILDLTKRLLKENQIQYKAFVSEHKNQPFNIAHKEKLNEYDAVAVIGGDGTMHEVINGMLSRSDNTLLPIGLITAGTGNSLMHDLNCLDPKKAIMNLINGHTRKIDILKIDSESGRYYSFNIIGLGIPVDINRIAEKLRWIGSQRYNIASIVEIFRNRSRPVKLILDDHIIEDHLSFFLSCNTVYTGNGMKMSPHSIMDDGKVNIFYFKKASRLKLLKLFSKVFSGRHLDDPVLIKQIARSFEIITTLPQELNVDGQGGYYTPIKAEVSDIQLDIFTPLECLQSQ